MNDIASVEESRQAIVKAHNWPSSDRLAVWGMVELIKRYKRYSVQAQDDLCHDRLKEWAAWGQAADMIGAEIASRSMGITWLEAFNLLSLD